MDEGESKINERYPVFNDALAFLWCKMDIAPKDTLIGAMKDFYSLHELKIVSDILNGSANRKVIQF